MPIPIPTAYVDFDTTLAINGSPLFNEPRSSRAYGLTHTPQRCLCAAYRNSPRRLRRSNRSNRRQPIKHRSRRGGVRLTLHALSALGPHNGDYQMLTTERSDALRQLISDVACCRQRNARHNDSHPARVSTPQSSCGARARQSELDSRNLVAVS